ncbi:hypothetical protein [uncultured Jatrophihabitans sp.]|uniref:hypothetical protein n=1 Tax=uncultured Jatrophihabitans sp. TaxID=1610747 RepID=UPI0035CA255A
MIVEELGSQAVAHDSGAIVASVARDSFVYARAGRTISLPVEPLDIYYVRLPDTAVWSDGRPLGADEAQQLLADVTATFEHWGERCELVRPDDPRILRTLDQLVTYIRAEAGGT